MVRPIAKERYECEDEYDLQKIQSSGAKLEIKNSFITSNTRYAIQSHMVRVSHRWRTSDTTVSRHQRGNDEYIQDQKG